jgi:hypothetical protein
MIKRSEIYFRYPSNLNMLDLATLVSMYRNRGEPLKAPSGEYFACSHSFKLVKEAKCWFGLYYTQSSWDHLLTRDSKGYPLTEAELNILGLAAHHDENPNSRSFIEKNCMVTPQLAYMIVNDLKSFGFLLEDDHSHLLLTEDGEDALNGLAKRIYDRKYIPEMLLINHQRYLKPNQSDPQKATKASQIDLF